MSLSSKYGINTRPSRQLDLPVYEEEDEISFDGTNLDDIIALALQKAQTAQANDDDDDDNNDDGGDDDSNSSDPSNFCDVSQLESLVMQPLEWEYTVEYLSYANVTAIVEKLEPLLESRLAGLVLECNIQDGDGANIVGETATPTDIPDDDSCSPDHSGNTCQHYGGKISLYLVDDTTAGQAVSFARSKIEQVFADPSFVLEVSLGLISVKFRQSEALADIEDAETDVTERSPGQTSESSFVMITTFAGGFVFFAVILFVWRRKCYKSEARHDLDGGTTTAGSTQINAPATITIDTEGFEMEEAMESPFSESPYSSRLQYYDNKHDWGRPLSYISEVTESRSSDSESGMGSRAFSHSPSMSVQTPISIDELPSENGSLPSPDALRDFIGMYSSNKSRVTLSNESSSVLGTAGSSVLGAAKRYRRNDFNRGQMADAASISSNSESSHLSAVADDSTASDASSEGESTNNVVDGEHLLNRTRDSEAEQEDDFLFIEEV
eukprot:CAMPEP_0168754360 /NCGR_PEP_ID=MMETSP0724-20121128/19459_1 /TAXON_ID=265536 /ORGANISM="Amphiprora sp., Strain CCMP467" /LENGTH=495 /DNA_ID=CAMNT_0008802833 /DNA_START=3 /DNA_END=1490 /DNA_ORIENTATION=+